MIHPLHIMTDEQPENRDLIGRSIKHWLTVDNGREVFGWSRAAAASLYATLGDGDNAIDQIHRHMADARFVRPNTQYIEGDPVIECSIVLDRSLQDMLLQSWGNKINVFPAVPKAWDAAVSTTSRRRRLPGQCPAQGRPDPLGARQEPGRRTVPDQARSAALDDGAGERKGLPHQAAGSGLLYELPLAKGDEALLTEDARSRPLVAPLPAEPRNPWESRPAASPIAGAASRPSGTSAARW